MILTGSHKEGKDARVARGAYPNPDNENEWSSEPYPSQVKEARMYDTLINHIAGKRSIKDELELVNQKKSKLSRRMRDYLIQLCKETFQI